MSKKYKRLIILIITFLFFLSTLTAHAEPVITERKGAGVEQWLWDELSQYSPSDAVTAGVLSYFWRESQYRSDSVAGWGNIYTLYKKDICITITKKTDKGLQDGSSRQYFIEKVRAHGGYGLGQWYSMSYLKDLYDYAQEYGTSIGDAKMQCSFIFKSLRKNKKLWKKLKKCKDPGKAGELIAIYYDGSQSGAEYMKYKAIKLYKKYT